MAGTRSNPDTDTNPPAHLLPHTFSADGTPFWNMNIPPHLHTAKCPDYLEYAWQNHKDREILCTPDNLYVLQTWPEVQQYIRENRLDLFQRVPSDLRLYRQYCGKVAEEWGSVMEFVMKERLKWDELRPRGGPFQDPCESPTII